MTTAAFLLKLDVLGYHTLRILMTIMLQSAILFVIAGAAAYMLRRKTPEIRHMIWAFALISMPLLPILVWMARETGTPQVEFRVLPSYTVPYPSLGTSPLTVTPMRSVSAPRTGNTTGDSVEEKHVNPFFYPWAMGLIAYAATAGTLMALVIMGRLRIQRWKWNGIVVIDKRALGIFENVRNMYGIERRFMIVETEEIQSPLTIGTIHPVIMLPIGYVDDLTNYELRSIALHELAHVRRFDSFVLTIVSLVRALLFFHPLVWYAANMVSTLAENSCDDAVIEALGDQQAYAELLLRLAQRFTRRNYEIELAAGFIFSKKLLLQRVKLILDERGIIRRTSNRLIAVALAAMTLSMIVVCALPVREKALPLKSYFIDLNDSKDTITEYIGGAREIVPDTELGGIVLGPGDQPLEGVVIDRDPARDGGEILTGPDGRFSLSGLSRQHRVLLRFTKDGYSPELVVQQKTAVGNIIVRLTDKTFFEGVVTGQDGRPVAGAHIRARQPMKFADGYMTDMIWTETVSGADGSYRLYVEDDTYDIQVKADGAGVARFTGETIEKNRHRKLDIRLTDPVNFRARVVDSITGEPVSGFRLSKRSQGDMDGVSGQDGVVTISGMIPGQAEFDAGGKGIARWWSDDAVHMFQKKRVHGERIQRNYGTLTFDLAGGMKPVVIVVEQAVTITGAVVDPDGNPVAGATVAPALTGTGNSITGDTRFSFPTDEDGRFEMLLPASHDAWYNIVAHDGKHMEWRTWANGVMEPIRTTPGQRIDNVVISLSRPCAVRGIVIDRNGRPIADHEVIAQSSDKKENRYYDPMTRSDANGRFELNFIRPGRHTIAGTRYLGLDGATLKYAPEGVVKEVELTDSGLVENITLVGYTRHELDDSMKGEN